jgi:hypothetical protein
MEFKVLLDTGVGEQQSWGPAKNRPTHPSIFGHFLIFLRGFSACQRSNKLKLSFLIRRKRKKKGVRVVNGTSAAPRPAVHRAPDSQLLWMMILQWRLLWFSCELRHRPGT